MTLIIIALALASERLLTEFHRWREYNWFGLYLEWLHELPGLKLLWRSVVGLIVLLPVLGAVMVVQFLLLHWLDGPLRTGVELLFSLIVLVLSLGPRDLWEEVLSLVAAHEANDRETVDRLTQDLCAVAGRRPSAATGRSVVNAVLIQGNERLFGVLIWFFVLGPVGALLYRLASEMPVELRRLGVGQALLDVSLRLHGLVAWVPIRLSALLYGLAGDTDGAIAGWKSVAQRQSENWVQRGWQLLACTGAGALTPDYDDDHPRFEHSLTSTLREALALVRRSLLILLGGLAAFTLGGWIA